MRRAVTIGTAAAVLAALATWAAPAAATTPQSATPPQMPGRYVVIDKRPSTVPSDYVVTPNGYFHASCVHQIAENQMAIPVGDDTAVVNVTEARKRLARSAMVGANPAARPGLADMLTADEIAQAPRQAKCGHPRYDLTGREVPADAQNKPHPTDGPIPTIGNAWVESANWLPSSAMSYLDTYWNMPGSPPSQSGQTVYFFPGFEPANYSFIMQPVLAWNQGGAAGSGWSISSWDCCQSGITNNSAPIQLSGTVLSIRGVMSGTGCNASTGICSSWTITTSAITPGGTYSTPFNTTSHGLPIRSVRGGVLEVWNLSACNQFPTSDVTFNNFTLRNVSGAAVSPSWSYALASGSLNPQCNYAVGIPLDGTVTMNYSNLTTNQYLVDTFASAPGYRSEWSTSPQSGSLNSGTSYVYCKVWGRQIGSGSSYNHYWLRTDLDSGSPWQNQYVSAYYLSRWGNDVAKDNNGTVIPDC